MLVYRDQNRSQIYDALAVQLQARYGRSACWRPPDDQRIVLAPCKVITPTITTRMKQRGQNACERIGGFGAGIFQVVATLTGERQIGWRISSAKDAR